MGEAYTPFFKTAYKNDGSLGGFGEGTKVQAELAKLRAKQAKFPPGHYEMAVYTAMDKRLNKFGKVATGAAFATCLTMYMGWQFGFLKKK